MQDGRTNPHLQLEKDLKGDLHLEQKKKEKFIFSIPHRYSNDKNILIYLSKSSKVFEISEYRRLRVPQPTDCVVKNQVVNNNIYTYMHLNFENNSS